MEDDLKQEIVTVGSAAFLKGLTAGWGGNISARREDATILITPHGKSLGFMTADDIITVDRTGKLLEGNGRPSTETGMHCALYNATGSKAVVHLHPPCINSLVSRDVPLQLDIFETRLILGKDIPVLDQDTPIVTDIDALLGAFKTANIVFLKNHGVIAAGDDLQEAFALADVAEEAARLTINGMIIDRRPVESGAGQATASGAEALPVFSREHMTRIQKLVNEDEEAQNLGRSTGLTVNYAIKQLDDGKVFNIHFDEGKIAEITEDENADFVNAGKREIWIHVFNGRLDPFAATSQKKLRLQKGHIGDLAKWYAPFYRIFALWKDAPVKELHDE
ncbi:MAG: class II aldolase/adducin family protein [Candidatus Latescibacterota bacterium]|jgi:L-fuculose-phosphate aldolase